MAAWPITEPELLDRLALDDRAFEAHYLELAARMPPRRFGAEQLVRALGYPWRRPPGSFLLRDGAERPLATVGPAERERLLAELADPAERSPLLAIGSNAAPAALAAKLAHFERAADRELLALAGRLHDFDIGAAAQPALYGSLPATIFPSPGTAVEATLLWLTPAQYTQLAWSEVSYRLGRLHARFELAESGESLDSVTVFVSRFGSFAPDGEPLALAAVPAAGRRAEALSQADLLDRAAALVFGPGSGGEELVRAVVEDLAGVAPRIAATLWRAGIRFERRGWEPLASARPSSQ